VAAFILAQFAGMATAVAVGRWLWPPAKRAIGVHTTPASSPAAN
jgi:hypothetical protein